MKRTPIERKTPLRRKSPTKRRRAAVCPMQRCSGRPAINGVCISHAERLADKLFSEWIRARDGTCTVAPLAQTPCGGPLQCAHVIGRGKHLHRYDPANSHAACRDHHARIDQHQELGLKVRWAVSRLGEEGWQRLIERSWVTTPRLVAVTAALEWLT